MSVSSLRSFEYLEQLPGTTFRRLYQQPSTALAVFRRMLPHLAKSFVMAMLFLPDPLPTADLELWVQAGSKREKDQALSHLYRLHIVTSASDPGKAQTLRLTKPFAPSLRRALTGGGHHHSFGVPCATPDKHPASPGYLDAFARAQWEGILHYMVGSSSGGGGGGGNGPSHGVKKLLELGGLVEMAGRTPEITQAGFAFLLQEVNAQIWTLLVFYLENAESLHMDSVDVLSFLFMLGSLELGQDYSVATLTATQIQMLDDLQDFGIIYRRTAAADRFYPTRLATTLTSDGGALRSVSAGFDRAIGSGSDAGAGAGAPQADAHRGFIVIETNYRLYAYTSSPLQIAVLALFSRLSLRFPNMVVGRITRHSIRRAIAMGITSDQIIAYLGTHAHPQLRRQSPVLPATVVDQIRLWQIEGERMKATAGFLFKDFGSAPEYDGPCRYAQQMGVLVWKNDGRRMFFVTRYEDVALYLKQRAASKKTA
ncbi:MAG: RNA polymerase II transcription factor B 52 kDa subunit [Phylliscum demangeonii]|nr:MAG: RNA polymerase II transcription factor B 52 kDa subunit [Phylliscum demangeonii]